MAHNSLDCARVGEHRSNVSHAAATKLAHERDVCVFVGVEHVTLSVFQNLRTTRVAGG